MDYIRYLQFATDSRICKFFWNCTGLDNYSLTSMIIFFPFSLHINHFSESAVRQDTLWCEATSTVEHILFFNHCVAINVSKLEDRMYIDIQEEIYDRSLFLVLYQETEIGMVYLWFWKSFFVSETDWLLWRLWCFCRCFVAMDQISSPVTFFFWFEILVPSNCLVARCSHRFFLKMFS